MKKRAAVQKAPPAMRRIDCARMKCLALTFDDGPGDRTGTLLDELRRSGTRATFFLLGSNVGNHPDLVRRMVYEGHEVGNHSWSHKPMTTLSSSKVRAEIRRTQDVIRRASGVEPKVFRPPYGATDEQVARAVGLPQIIWSVDPMDWQRKLSGKKIDLVVKQAEPGGVILLHDIHPQTVKSAPTLIQRLKGNGFTLVTVSELFQSGRLHPGTSYTDLSVKPSPSPSG